MSINQNFPEIRPSLNLNFARSKILDPRITFTRASTATYVGADGLINTAVADEARFDHDPTTGESLGLLIEESRTNFVTNSDHGNQILNNGVTATQSNNYITPDGLYGTCIDVQHSSTGTPGYYRVGGTVSITAGQSYTVSLFVRNPNNHPWEQSANGTYLGIHLYRNGTGQNANFGFGSVDMKKEYYPSGWTRYSATFVAQSTATVDGFFSVMTSVTTYLNWNYQLWGFQLEEGSFATSYIPTSGSTVTRAADIASIEGSEFTKTNLLEYSERFDQSAWAKVGTVSVVPNSALSPDGLMTADQITLGTQNARIGQFDLITTTGQTGTASVYLKNIDHVGALTLRTGLSGGVAYNLNLSLTNEWVRYELTTTHNGTQNVEFHLRETDANPSGSFLIWGAQLEEGDELTKYTPSVESFVSRASTGTYVGSDGLIKTSPVNLRIYSEEIDTYSTTEVTVTANQFTSPDGTFTADRVDITSADNAHFVQVGQTTPGSTSSTTSVYVKAISNVTQIQLNSSISGGRASAVFDLVNVTTDSALSGNVIFVDSSISSVGNGWYRISLAQTTNGANAPVVRLSFTNGNADALDDRNGQAFVGTNESVAVWGAQVEEGTTATDYIPTGATISGAPRFDHDPVTGESLGLLIEESRTNELTFSSTLDGYGTSGIASKTQNAGIAPDGTNTAVLAETITTGNDSHLRETTSQVVNTTYTYSFFAKPGTVDYAVVYNIAKNGVGLTWFNVANGTIGTTASGVTPFIKPAGNGWYRVGVTLTTDSTITNNLVDIRWDSSDGVNNPTTGENVYVWGAQLEVGSFPTSYIPTSGSTVTRAADVSTSALGVDSWYNQSEGTWFTDMSLGFTQNAGNPYKFGGVYYTTVVGSVRSLANSTLVSGLSNSLTVPSKTALGMKPGDYKLYRDGTQPANSTSTSSYVPVGTELRLAPELGGMGRIKRLAYYQTRLSDDKLKSITISNPNRYPYMQSIVYNITNSGGTFILRSFGTVNYSVSWNNNEGYEASTSNTLSHTYSAGNYVVRVYSNGVYRPYFINVTADANQITSVVIGSEVDLGTDLTGAWEGAKNMTTFTCEFSLTSSVTRFSGGFKGTALSSFPLIDTSSVTDISVMFNDVTELTTLPLLDLSSVTTGRYFLAGCSGITSLPAFNLSSANNLQGFASNATSLASLPAFTFTNTLSRIDQGFQGCSSLADVPANLFDNCSGLSGVAFSSTFSNCALTAQSIENILVSLDTNGSTGITLSINGGTSANASTWSAAAIVAYKRLINKGWTITQNGTVPAIITYGITSTGGVFNLRSTGTVNYESVWGDGSTETSTLNTLQHTYAAGNYSLAVNSNVAYTPYFNNVTADANQITSVVIGSGADLGTLLTRAWYGASNITTFTCPFDVTSSVTDFRIAWQSCANLTSFPLLNTSSGTRFDYAWAFCSSLSDFPANMFDTTGTLNATAFNSAWLNCALTAQSIENILTSLDTNGANGITLGIHGGTNAGKTTWSTAAVTAYDNLIVKGWTIYFNA